MTLLADYISSADLADDLGVSERTLARYENQPDGLPVTLIGGRKFYRMESLRKWLAARERRPNPRRQPAVRSGREMVAA